MTTLQLAMRVADAARSPVPGTTPAEAVMDALRTVGCWFCRLTEPEGATVFTPLPVPGPGPHDQSLPFEAL